MIWPFKRSRRAEESIPAGLDLRHLESTRTRVKGSVNYVPEHLRHDVGGQVYVLRREPTNEHDTNAIVVLWKGRKVGYVSAVRAKAMSPLLDELGHRDFVVSGMGAYTNSTRLWVDLPRIAELRAFVADRR